MKKIFLLLVCLPIYVLADDCANAYKAGSDLYKHGKYAEAQVKFIAVAKVCGEYADVWDKIKSCNQKLAEKQTEQAKQLASLKAEMKKQEDSAKAKPTLNSEASNAIGKLINDLNSTKQKLQDANDTIGVLKTCIAVQLDKIDSLQQQIAEMTKPAPVPVPQKKTVAEIEQEIKNCKAAQKALEAEKKEAKQREKQKPRQNKQKK